jgi:hypothetical protein
MARHIGNMQTPSQMHALRVHAVVRFSRRCSSLDSRLVLKRSEQSEDDRLEIVRDKNNGEVLLSPSYAGGGPGVVGRGFCKNVSKLSVQRLSRLEAVP